MTVVYIFFTALGAIVAFNIISWLVNRQKLHRIIDKLPGPKSYPIVGCLLAVRKVPREDRWEWFNNLLGQYEDGIFRMWIGERPFVHLIKPKCVEEILRSTELIEKSQSYDFLTIWLGTGLLLSSGVKWRRHRKMISPTFHLSILEDFAKAMSEKADIFNQCVEAEFKKNPGEPMDVFVMLTRMALDIICESAMGIESNTQTSQQTDYTQALESTTELIAKRIFQPWLHWDWLYYLTADGKRFKKSVELAHEFTDRVIQERKQALQKGKLTRQDSISDPPKRKAFLDHLLEACEDGEKMTDEELRHEVDTFTFAGHDTTSTAMSFALFSIGNDPKVQEKLDEEFEHVFGDSKEPATFQDLTKLKYLERVIKETLRLYPSAPNVSRRMTRDIEIGGYKVPADATVTIHISKIHRDPEHWPDPDKFDPDRFLPENSQGRHPYAYIPFSAGPRNCIGQKYAMLEAKIALTAILRKWNVKSQLKQDELKLRSEIILKSTNGVKIYFTPK